MKHQKALFVSVVALGLSAIVIAINPSIRISASYNSELTWWENDCQLPDGYTSISSIVDSGVTSTAYTTRGTITSIEGNSYFVQSQNRGFCIYNTNSSYAGFSLGNVVDVTGTRSDYYNLIELSPTAASLYATTNPYPVISANVSSSNYTSFCTADNVGRLMTLSGMTVTDISSKTITFDYDGVTVNGRITSSSYDDLTTALTTYKNNNTSIDFQGILSVYNTTYQIRLYDTSCLSEHADTLINSISVSPVNSNVDRGGTIQFSASISPSDASNQTISWSTTGGGTIDSSGLFTSTTAGTYTITATAQDGSGVTGTTSITVNQVSILVTSITIDCSSSTFAQNNDYTFTASVLPSNADNTNVNWSASVGTITSTGVYTASNLGTVVITATAQDGSGVTGTKTITVVEQSTPTEGTVIANPTLSGDTLGPLYSPGTNDEIVFTYLEMINLYGDSLLFDYGNFEVLIDAGQTSDEDNVMAALSKYVTDGCLEVLIVTHPHSDHLGGLGDYSSMISNGGITSIKYIVDFGGTYTTTVYNNYVTTRNYYIGQGATYYSIYEMVNNSSSGYPNIFNICNDINIYFLDSGAYTQTGVAISSDYANESSVCTLFSFGTNRILCCGDLTNSSSSGGTPETYLIDKYGPSGEGLWSASTTNIVKANHHCSNTHGSNSSDWVDGTLPDYVIISAALVSANRSENSDNVSTSQHPNATSLARYLAATSNVYCNIVNGSTHFTYATTTSNPVLSFDGRTLNYSYNGTIVSAETEKAYLLTQSSFYSQLYS
ncbi:MAG: Ig-like domain-containing protein [Erysipelotrichaceae bacterium]|nr:Ig-like domain-containing protein [Erysipelotrichaceae bacterium]